MGKIISTKEILKRLNNFSDFSEYDIFNNSINGSTKKAKFKHKKCGSEFDMIVKDFIGGQRCPICAHDKRVISNTKSDNKDKNSSRSLRPFEYYKELSFKKYGFDYNIDKTSFVNSKIKCNITHNICGNIFKKNMQDFIHNSQGCPKCAKSGKSNSIEYVIEKFNSKGFILLNPESYKGTHCKSMLQCKDCGEIQERSFNTIVNLDGFCSCKKGRLSKGEYFIKEILKSKGINFIQNKTFDDLKYISALRLDFYIEDLNLVIEYDGSQHFLGNNFFRETQKEIKNRDISKNEYCIKNGINIVRISYLENTYKKINKSLSIILGYFIDGKPYDGKLSCTVWVGGKSNFEDYLST